jgi:thioredoxin-related protein
VPPLKNKTTVTPHFSVKHKNTALAAVPLLFALVSLPHIAKGGDTTNGLSRIYDETGDGFKQVADAVASANKDGKRVLLDFGYNRCVWCQRLHGLFEGDKQINRLLKANYVVAYIDWSKGGTNSVGHNREVDAKYEAKCEQGVPSLVVLDSDGKRLTTKDTGELEAGDHHSPQKVLPFLKEWVQRR